MAGGSDKTGLQCRAGGPPSNRGSYSKKQVAREFIEMAHGAKRLA
jgi:hypothetical protein